MRSRSRATTAPVRGHKDRPRPQRVLANSVVQPGYARLTRVHAPIREALAQSGVFRPLNRWRGKAVSHDKVAYNPPSNPADNVLQRPLMLAKHLPFDWRYNSARA